MDRFSIVIDRSDDRIDLVLNGEIDLAVADELSTALDEAIAAARAVWLDFSGVDFIDSMGLRTLIKAVNNAETSGVDLRLSAVSPPVSRVFDLAGVAELFPLAVETGRDDAS